MEIVEVIKVFKEAMDKQSDNFSNITKELSTLVEKQTSTVVELKEATNILRNVESKLTDGLQSRIKDDVYIVTGECRVSMIESIKNQFGKMYWKIAVCFAVGFIILVLCSIFKG